MQITNKLCFILSLALAGACDDPSTLSPAHMAEESTGGTTTTATEAPPDGDRDADLEPRSAGKAMTWAKLGHNATIGTDNVGCSNCNAYTGDTQCTAFLPVLCIKQDNSPKPSSLTTDFYSGWTGGHIATTHAIQGSTLTSLQVANQFCVDNFGAGWRMAEFHDGNGGWTFTGKRGAINEQLRHWVHINDQPGNCWDAR